MAISQSLPTSTPGVATPQAVLLGWGGAHNAPHIPLFEPVTGATFTPVAVSVSAASASPVEFTVLTRDAAGNLTPQFVGTFPAGASHADATTLGMGVLTLPVGDDVVAMVTGVIPGDGAGLVIHYDVTA